MDVEPYAVLSGTGLLDKGQDKSQAESHAESVSVETIKGFAALNPPRSACPRRGWTPAQVAWLLDYGESKVRMADLHRPTAVESGRGDRAGFFQSGESTRHRSIPSSLVVVCLAVNEDPAGKHGRMCTHAERGRRRQGSSQV